MNLDHIKYQLEDDELRGPLLEGEISLVPGSMLNIDLEIVLGLFIGSGPDGKIYNPRRGYQAYRATLNL